MTFPDVSRRPCFGFLLAGCERELLPFAGNGNVECKEKLEVAVIKLNLALKK